MEKKKVLYVIGIMNDGRESALNKELCMKRIILAIYVVLLTIGLAGNRVENRPFTFTQPDGSELQLLVSGDEYYHRVHDERGYTILKDVNTGFAVYAENSGSSFRASGYRVGTLDPGSVGITPGLIPDQTAALARAAQNQRNRDSGNRASPTGSVNSIVAFVHFSGQGEFSSAHNYAHYDNFFNLSGGPSLKHFYSTMSSNQLTLNASLYPSAGAGGLVVSLEADHIRGYYSPYNASSNPSGYETDVQGQTRLAALITEMLDYLNPLIPDNMNVDNDNNGIVDALTFIIAGSDDTWGDILWPAHWSWSGSLGTINGKNVNHFVLDFETGLGLSVICHEMGHMIGAPDLYHYSNAPMGSVFPWNTISPVSRWDLMDSDNTQFWLTYMKWKYGTWFSTIPTITPTSTGTTYTLQAIDSSPYSCYKIASTIPSQYYMLEYRRQTAPYDDGVPGSGLIVYRINSAGINGNSQGPPDEVYVYRPGGDVDSNGTPYAAFFSQQSLRTEINNFTDPKPWLWVDTVTTPDGNLVIYDVSASGANSITFKVRTSPVSRWTGNSSVNWDDTGNWTAGVPTSSRDAVIPAGCPRYPTLNVNASSKDLTIETGGSLNVSSKTMGINGNASVAGTLIMNNSAGQFFSLGDINWMPGVSIQFSNEPQIILHGNMNVASGANLALNHGSVKFIGSGESTITCLNMSSFHDLICEKGSSGRLIFGAGSTSDVYVYGDMQVLGNGEFLFSTGRTITIYGNLHVDETASLHCNAGTIKMGGSSTTSITLNSDDYLFDLRVDKTGSGSVLLPSELNLNGSFYLSSGSVYASNYMKLQGGWTNSVGPTAFMEGSGTVEFNGPAHQYVYNTEDFNILKVNCGAALRLNNVSTTVTCNSYDWVEGGIDVLSGTFTANDLADNGIYGGFWVNPNGVINLYQDASAWPDLNGKLYNYGGTINIWGGLGDCYWAYSAEAGVTMSAGTIDWKDRGISITGMNPLTVNVTGGTIRCNGNVTSTRSEAQFTGGSLELYGSGTTGIAMLASNYLNDLTVNKTPTRYAVSQSLSHREYERLIDYRTEGVILTTEIICHGSLSVLAGTLDLGSNPITAWNDINIYSGLTMSSGTITCGDDFNWYGSSSAMISTGLIYCSGNWRFESGANVDLSGTVTTLSPDYDANIYCGTGGSRFGNLTLSGNGGGDESNFVVDPSSTGTLLIANNLVINPANGLILGEISCTVNGLINLYAEAWLEIGDGSTCVVDGNFVHNGIVDIGPGELIVHGVYTTSNTSHMTINQGVFRNDVAWRQAVLPDPSRPEQDRSVIQLRGAIQLYSGTYEITHNSVYLYSHANRIWSGGTFRAGVGFNASEAGAFQQNGGTLEIFGSDNPALIMSSGNYLNNLTINLNPAKICYLQAALTLNGNLLISSGGFSTNNYAINLKGTWTNNSGAANFYEGSSVISFLGDSQNTGFSTSETVYGIIINNSSSVADNFELSPGVELSVLYDLQIMDGTLNMKNNSRLSIGRDLSISSGAGLNAAGGSNLFIRVDRNWTDANNTYSAVLGFNPGTSTLTFGGGLQTIVLTNDDVWDVYHLNVDKSSAVYFKVDQAVRIYGNCNLSNCTWQDQASGITHRFYGNLNLGANTSWDPNNNNTISFQGTGAQSFGLPSSTYIRSLALNKTVGSVLILSSDVYGLGGGNVIINSGVLDLNGHLYRSTGNVTIGSTGVLEIDSDAEFELASAKTLTVNSGGKLQLIGSSGHYAKLSRQSGYYICNIESGGIISADWALFEYMGTSGINVKSGALVDSEHSFNNCRFQEGASGGCLLTINNNQILQISGAVFPANVWSGAYNVSKSVNQGSVSFSNPSGAFAGEDFDQDSYNLISWLALPQVPTPTISYNSSNNRIHLSWTYPVTVTQFRIYRSDSPDGSWQSVGTSATTSWSQVAPGTRSFYKVVAEQ